MFHFGSYHLYIVYSAVFLFQNRLLASVTLAGVSQVVPTKKYVLNKHKLFGIYSYNIYIHLLCVWV